MMSIPASTIVLVEARGVTRGAVTEWTSDKSNVAELRTARKTVVEIVGRYVAEEGDDPEAIERFLDHVDRLPPDQRRELLRLGVMAAIASIEADERKRQAEAREPIVKRATRPAPLSTSGVAARVAQAIPNYSWQLPNGSELLEANIADLESAIEVHGRKAKQAVAEVKLLATIKAEMQRKRAARVGDLYTGAQIERMRGESGLD